MVQTQLPFFPVGSTHITSWLVFEKKDDRITYFNGGLPVFEHAEDDDTTFRMITAQFVVNGAAKQMDIVRAFGVTQISVKRAVKLYRKEGTQGFYKTKRVRSAAVLIPEVLSEAQSLLIDGKDITEVAEELGIKRDTVYRATLDGRLFKVKKKS